MYKYIIALICTLTLYRGTIFSKSRCTDGIVICMYIVPRMVIEYISLVGLYSPDYSSTFDDDVHRTLLQPDSAGTRLLDPLM